MVAQFQVRKDIAVPDISRAQHTYHPLPLVSWIKKREREIKKRKGVRKFFFSELIFSKLVYLCETRRQCAEVLSDNNPVVWLKLQCRVATAVGVQQSVLQTGHDQRTTNSYTPVHTALL